MVKPIRISCLALVLVAPFATAQQPADLGAWTVEDLTAGGTWVVHPPSGVATFRLSIAHARSVLYSDFPILNKLVKARIKVATNADDDYIGFVLGFRPGDGKSRSANYLLVDWKQTTQVVPGQGTANMGLALSRVNGPGQTAPNGGSIDFWSHVGHVTELARARTLGSTGWADLVEYAFEFYMTPTLVRIKVNDSYEFNLLGAYTEGRFGLYNFSQEETVYRQIEIVSPAISTRDTPRPGNTVNLQLCSQENPGKPYIAAASLGNRPGVPVDVRVIPLNPDPLMVLSFTNPLMFQGFQGILDAQGSANAATRIPPDAGLVGFSFYTGFITLDPGAPSGIARIAHSLKLMIVS